MGNCTVGPHHNGRKEDVEHLAADFVERLKAAGHSVQHAGVTVGGEMDVTDRSQLIPVVTES